MDIIRKIAGLSTPQAPKFKSLDLPALGEGEVPPLAPGWSSSDSGSSVSSSSPTTPSTSPTPWRKLNTPYKSPSVRSPTPQYDVRSPAWHVMTTEQEKSTSRQTLTPSPEILKPRPRRLSSTHNPSPVQVMQGLVSPQPITAKPLKSILKHSAPPSSVAPSPAPPPIRTNEIMLHWQLCPYPTYKAGRQLRVEFDVSKPVDLIVIRDYSHRFQTKLPDRDVKMYLDRKVCEVPALRKMTIHYETFPQWTVVVTRSDGDVLRVRDVFEAMYQNLRATMNRRDRQTYIPEDKITECSAAFKARCQASMLALPDCERKAGMRRVDLLMGNSAFLGLTRPEKDDQDYWIAHFGPLPSPR